MLVLNRLVLMALNRQLLTIRPFWAGGRGWDGRGVAGVFVRRGGLGRVRHQVRYSRSMRRSHITTHITTRLNHTSHSKALLQHIFLCQK